MTWCVVKYVLRKAVRAIAAILLVSMSVVLFAYGIIWLIVSERWAVVGLHILGLSLGMLVLATGYLLVIIIREVIKDVIKEGREHCGREGEKS